MEWTKSVKDLLMKPYESLKPNQGLRIKYIWIKVDVDDVGMYIQVHHLRILLHGVAAWFQKNTSYHGSYGNFWSLQ